MAALGDGRSGYISDGGKAPRTNANMAVCLCTLPDAPDAFGLAIPGVEAYLEPVPRRALSLGVPGWLSLASKLIL